MPTPTNDDSLTVGIWLPIDFRGHWKGEGIARIVKYTLEGATRLPEAEQVQFRLYVSAWAAPEVEADLASIAPVLASGAITVVPFVQHRRTWQLLRLLKRMERSNAVAQGTAPRKNSLMGEVIRRIQSKLCRIVMKPVTRVKNFFTTLVALGTAFYQRRDMQANAQRANGDGVDVWWTPYAGADGVQHLRAPIVAHFFDFMPVEFPSGWAADDAGLLALYHRFQAALGHATRVIVTSEHALRDQLLPHFPVKREQVHLIPNPYPDYYRGLVSSVAAGQGRATIRHEAGRIISDYIRTQRDSGTWPLKDSYTQNYLLPYYASIDWENTVYFFAATQDRPYKNLKRLVELVEDLMRREGMDVKLVLTAGLDMTSQNALARYVYSRDLTRHIISLPRVPDEVHAALYAAAHGTLHASYIEGGIACASFIEGLYLDCPGLYARGPHTDEAAALLGADFGDYLFLADRPDELKEKVLELLENREEALARQARAHAAQAHQDAAYVCAKYLAVFREAAGAAHAD